MGLQYVLRFIKVTIHGEMHDVYLGDEGEYVKKINYTSCELTDFTNAKRFTWDELFGYPEPKPYHWEREMEDLSSYTNWLADRWRRAHDKFVLEVRWLHQEGTSNSGYYLIEDLKYETIMDKIGQDKLLSYEALIKKLDAQYYSMSTYDQLSGGASWILPEWLPQYEWNNVIH